MEKSNTDRDAVADANFIGWSRWAALELIHALTPRTDTHARNVTPPMKVAPANTESSPPAPGYRS